MSRHLRSTAGLVTAGLLLLGSSTASAGPAPSFKKVPACADISYGDGSYTSTTDSAGTVTGAVVQFGERFGPTFDTPSCRDVSYSFTVVDDTGAPVDSQVRKGAGVTIESFTVPVPLRADGTPPPSVCLSGTTVSRAGREDSAPDTGCLSLALGGAPGLAWH